MTADELAAALRDKGWETVTVETFAAWLGGDPELLDALRSKAEDSLRIKVGKGPAQAMCAITVPMLETWSRETMVNYLHFKLRQAWADAVWEAS